MDAFYKFVTKSTKIHTPRLVPRRGQKMPCQKLPSESCDGDRTDDDFILGEALLKPEGLPDMPPTRGGQAYPS